MAAACQPSFLLEADRALLDCFDNDPRTIFDASDAERDSIPIFQTRHLLTLRKPKYEATKRQMGRCERHGVRLILPTHPEYPPALCTIPDPPPFLSARLAGTNGNGVCIVGSRHATPYGRRVSERFGRELEAKGVTVASGGAVASPSFQTRNLLCRRDLAEYALER